MDTLLNLNSSNSSPNEYSSVNMWEDENNIIPTSYFSHSSLGYYGKSIDLINRLHEITTSSLLLQVLN